MNPTATEPAFRTSGARAIRSRLNDAQDLWMEAATASASARVAARRRLLEWRPRTRERSVALPGDRHRGQQRESSRAYREARMRVVEVALPGKRRGTIKGIPGCSGLAALPGSPHRPGIDGRLADGRFRRRAPGLELSRGSSLGARREHLPGPSRVRRRRLASGDAPWELERIINESTRPTTIADRA